MAAAPPGRPSQLSPSPEDCTQLETKNSTTVAAAVGAENLNQVGFEIVEELQGHFVGIAAGMVGGGKVEVDPAGKGTHAVDAAVFAVQIKKRAIAAVVGPFREKIKKFLFRCKDIRATTAASAGSASDTDFGLSMTE